MSEQSNYNIAVVGATGAVGQKIIQILEEKAFPIKQLKALSSKRSAGTKITFNNKEITVEEATPESFEGVDIALFSAGGSVTKSLAQEAVKRGALVVDNTSAYRMDKDVPLIVPEVNKEEISNHKGIIANPNCSTIQMVAALKPIKDAFGLSRIIVSTYQSVSGSGNEAIKELERQAEQYTKGEEMEANLMPVSADKKHYPIAFNALPQIDVFGENGYTLEEHKMINETKKIFNAPDMQVAATCVRLPVVRSHAESVYIEVDKDGVTVEDIWKQLESAEGIVLQDNPSEQVYPTPLSAEDKDEVFVGRVRKDPDNDRGFHMWIVSDNLVKGAALNTVQIATAAVENNWLKQEA